MNGPLTPALSLGERELNTCIRNTAIRFQLPLPQGEGWGEGTIHRRSPSHPTYRPLNTGSRLAMNAAIPSF